MPTFFASPVIKVIAVVIALALLAGAVFLGIHSVKSWGENLYKSGFDAGAADATSKFEAAQVQAQQQAVEKLAAQMKAGQDAVQEYVKTLAEKKPRVVTVTKEIDRYDKSSDGAALCLDSGGVQLLKQARDAASGDHTVAPNPATGPPVGPRMRTTP